MTEAVQQDVAQVATETTPSSFAIPSEYEGKGWTQKVGSYDDLFKAYDNAQSLIGKRPEGIPTQESPPEEWDKFYTAMGRPEKADAYELTTEFEGLPEGADLTAQAEKAKGFFHKLGLSPAKAQEAWKDYIGMEMEAMQGNQAATAEQQAAKDAEFDTLTKELWGDNYSAVSEKARAFISSALPESLQPAMAEVADSPKALAAMIKVAEYAQGQIGKVEQEYGKEDTLSSGTQSTGASQHEILSKMMEVRTRASKAQPFSNERKAAEAELSQLQQTLAKFVK